MADVGLALVCTGPLTLLAANILLTLLVQEDAEIMCFLELLCQAVLLLLDTPMPGVFKGPPCINPPLLFSLEVTDETGERYQWLPG